MTTAPPFTGYRPRFEMPIIAPPPAGYPGSAEDYYQQLQVEVAVTLSGPNGEFADLALTRTPTGALAPDPSLFAVMGGFVRCYPAGTAIPSPDLFVEPARDSLVLTVWIDDIEAQRRAFQADTPPISRVYYVGIDAVETATLLRIETSRMSEAALRASWKSAQQTSPPPGTTTADLIDAHNLRVMNGTGALFVDGGTCIGKMTKDLTAALETFRITMRMTDDGTPPVYVPPLPTFLAAPYYVL